MRTGQDVLDIKLSHDAQFADVSWLMHVRVFCKLQEKQYVLTQDDGMAM